MGLTEDEFFNEPPYKFLLKQIHHHRSKEREWEQVRFIVASQYTTSPKYKRRVKPGDIIKLDIDGKHKRIEYDQELIEKVLRAWKPIKAEA